MPEAAREMFEVACRPDRFVLLGSFGRAAVLGDQIASLYQQPTARFKDIDLIDRSNNYNEKYKTPAGGVIDFLLTRLVRPVTDTSDMWGFYLPDKPEIPSATFPESFLELHEIDITNVGTAVTPSIPAHINLSSLHGLPLPKHQNQLRRLANQAPPNEELSDIMKFYARELNKQPQSRYQRIRRSLFRALPALSLRISDSTAGKIIRTARGAGGHDVIDPVSI